MVRAGLTGQIERAGPADLEGLLPLVEEFCTVDDHDFEPARVRTAPGPLLADDHRGQVWVLRGGSGPVGYAVVTWGWSLESGGLDALLDELYVRDRGRGEGGRLLTAAVAAAGAAGATRMFLETERPNEAVRRFYARHGFDEEGSVWMQRPL